MIDMRGRFLNDCLAMMLGGMLCFAGCEIAQAQALRGVNLAGPALSGGTLPGVYGWNFVYPDDREVRYFTQHGMNIFRISILWERLQPVLDERLDPAEFARLADFVKDAETHHASVLIDVHNYGYYRGELIGQKGVSARDFTNLWIRLAKRFGRDPQVFFGLMNEPKQESAEQWKLIVQQAVNGIRAAGARNRIFVAGIDWDSAQNFATINGATLGKLTDPQNKLVFEVHEYFDADSSGMSDRCVSPDEAVGRLTTFTQWLESNRAKGFLGEFGVSRRPECLAVLNKVTAYLQSNSTMWLGWTYWAAGPMWGEYMFTLEPKNGADRPQMKVLEPYLAKSGVNRNE